jgi:hypothetical protein
MGKIKYLHINAYFELLEQVSYPSRDKQSRLHEIQWNL